MDKYSEFIISSIDGCLFLNNTSETGGNIYGIYPGKFQVLNCLFLNNSARIASSIYIEQQCKEFFFT